jgi:hypothetical protein
VADLVAELEQQALRRFVRWDPALWRRVLDGPACTLAGSLQQAHASDTAARTLESYLRLASEAIGLGYLFPPEVGEGFFNHAFFRLLPEGLAALAPAAQAQALADCWNLGESLEHAPAWWRRMFVRLTDGGTSLGSLQALVERAGREAFGEPKEKLGKKVRHQMLDLGAEDRLFLPGGLHFVAPTVVCVHDRASPRTQGAWLADPPLPLGPMGCTAVPEGAAPRRGLVESIQHEDPCTAEARSAAASGWRAAFTLETSQLLVVVYPQ